MKYYNVLFIDKFKEKSFFQKVTIDIFKNLMLENEINSIVDTIKNMDSNKKRYDLVVVNSIIEENKKYDTIIEKMKHLDIPVVEIETDILIMAEKVFKYNTEFRKRESLGKKDYYLINYKSLKSLDLKRQEWINEQLEICVQILLNKGNKVILFSLDKSEEECDKFTKRFQNNNISYVRLYDIYDLVELISNSKLIIDFDIKICYLALSLGIPFLSIELKESILKIKSMLDSERVFLKNINAGNMIKKIEFILENYNLLVEKMNNAKKKYLVQTNKFLTETFIKIEPKKKKIAEINNFINKKKKSIDIMEYKKLHLGCGRNILKEWINLDLMKLPGVDVTADLDNCDNVKLPFSDNYFEEFYASHLIEHIKNTLPMMQELHRVAKPNAKAIFRCPYGSSDEAFEDPTHVRQYFINSFRYFGQPFYWRADYGYRGDWKVEKIILRVDKNKYNGTKSDEILQEVNKYRNIVKEMLVELKAIKPIRKANKYLQEKINIEFELQ